MGGGSLPADRGDVLTALRAHGLSAQAAASLWSLARALARDTRRRGREYGHLHTHPSNGSFSNADVLVLLSNREIRAIVAAGIDGRWHVLSRSEGSATAEPWEASDRFVLELRRLLDDADVPLVEAPHVAWTHIAAELGLRYDRVEGRS